MAKCSKCTISLFMFSLRADTDPALGSLFEIEGSHKNTYCTRNWVVGSLQICPYFLIYWKKNFN